MNKFRQIILEINNVSFKYYLIIYLILFILDIWKEDLIFKTFHFPIEWLMYFVIISGILKLFSNLDKLILYFRESNFYYSNQVLKLLSFLKEVNNYFCYLFWEFIKGIDSIFSWSLISYLILLLIEEFKEAEIIQNTLFLQPNPIRWILSGKMNWLLGIVVITGIISVLTKKPEIQQKEREKEKEKIELKDYLLIFGLGILGAFLIFYKIKELGWLSYVISAISGLLIILLSIIIFNEDEDET